MRMLCRAAAVAFTLSICFAGGASAQQARTWVSGLGDDASTTCSEAAPCKTFAGAVAKTAAGGEMDCLDPGGFGNVVITTSITIDCEAGTAGVLIAGIDGIVVNAAPTDVVSIKGVDLNGFGPTAGARNGIKIIKAGFVSIDHCFISNFGGSSGAEGNGIYVINPSAVSVSINDTLILNNFGAAIWVEPIGSGDATILISNIHASGNGFGVVFDGYTGGGTGRIKGAVSESAIDGSAHNGITASNLTATNISVVVDDVSVSGGGVVGLVANGANAGMIIGDSTVNANAKGVSAQNGGVLFSYGNNRVNGNNGADGAFTAVIPTH
jgi:hypothetical protein